ncbi:nucleotide exchange factor GrpE, partial [Algoriphagus aestuarii]|nr:nucleotide exchange factor GrpE [Algoriphagus aestuarii]
SKKADEEMLAKNEAKSEQTTQDNQEMSEEETPSQEVSVEEEMQQKYDELNDKYLRLYSEFDNFRRRTAKERIELITNAGEGLIKDLLPVLDDFERA